MAEEEAQAPEENAVAEGEAQAPAEEAAQAPEEAAPKPPSMLVPMILTSVLSVGGAYAIFQFAIGPSMVKGFEKVIKDSNGTLTIKVVQSEGGGGEKKEGEAGKEGEGGKAGEGGEEGEGGASKKETDAGEPVAIVEEGESIVVNPAGSSRFLMVEILLIRAKDEDNGFPDAVKGKRKVLEALVSTELSALSVEQISEPSTRASMPAEFKRLFQDVIGEHHPIKSVIISKWVMQ